uniref:Fe/B12 periplasmic-binding domain-containing protein n=1 Tax=Chromera velia CCMP2878 TaxID=1169474 RepID=A0A0G4HLD3_9ALVE|eukprot:Cvel_1128.t1-p1 / transcript=Cvel_1128.t1 / gene=Cvel_1128 / organism=Chromera_velia_CCMP2878 / gene_product=hypothetical protein / transcript_product=hypothetical protein / location=Cvel_scaffold37:35439-36419(+) / protein_length=327 / sequence_SO=supercontig / SO=protein_coding / is_pseudo=false
MGCGYWLPELVQRGGFECVGGGTTGPLHRTRTLVESELNDADVIVFACCGFTVERTALELVKCGLLGAKEWRDLPAVQSGRVFIADGNRFFNRSGPSIGESLRILCSCVHGKDAFADLTAQFAPSYSEEAAASDGPPSFLTLSEALQLCPLSVQREAEALEKEGGEEKSTENLSSPSRPPVSRAKGLTEEEVVRRVVRSLQCTFSEDPKESGRGLQEAYELSWMSRRMPLERFRSIILGTEPYRPLLIGDGKVSIKRDGNKEMGTAETAEHISKKYKVCVTAGELGKGSGLVVGKTYEFDFWVMKFKQGQGSENGWMISHVGAPCHQ